MRRLKIEPTTKSKPPNSVSPFNAQIIYFLLISLSLGFLIRLAYLRTKEVTDIASLPLIYKDDMQLRVRPSNPGGVVFANQNRQIYQNLKSNNRPSSAKPFATNPQPNIDNIINRYTTKPDK